MTFSLLIKPAGADCNLRCEYCFYLDRKSLYPETAVHRMRDDVLDRLVRSYLATEQPVHAFVWQGGEPLLMGNRFFERVADLQMAYARRTSLVSNAVQTNGVLLDDRFARQFRACRFLTGISLDGPERLHDSARRDAAGAGSHKRVLAGIECLKRNGAEFNILSLVSKHTVGHANEIYEYLTKDVGATFLQFVECVELDGRGGGAAPYSVSPREWGSFLCEIFDAWQVADTRRVSIRLFDTILAKLATGRELCCTVGQDCRQYFVVEHNGDVYPCDFHVLPEWRLGNILTHSWDEMAESETFRAFGARKLDLHADCRACEYLSLCAGDCPKNRVGHVPGPAHEKSYLCEGWRMFYAHALPRLKVLAETVRAEAKSGAAAS